LFNAAPLETLQEVEVPIMIAVAVERSPKAGLLELAAVVVDVGDSDRLIEIAEKIILRHLGLIAKVPTRA